MSEFLGDEDFERFRTLIYSESGIHFSTTNRSVLDNRLRERLSTSEVDSISAYYGVIRSNESELRILLDAVTTNLTRFFRNTSHIRTLEYFAIPELVKHKRKSGENKIRIWSAGCSTGEEPYTLAMILKELLPQSFEAEIIASDLSLKSLIVGEAGCYAESRVSGVPDEFLAKYFVQKGDGYQISDELKQMVRFDYHNLKHDSGLRNLDVVFCRNALIYFDDAAKNAVVNRFWDALAPKSYLFIGHSESLLGMKTSFEFLRTDWACIYKKDVTNKARAISRTVTGGA